MKKLKIEGPQDVFDIVRRRKWLMIVPFLLITIITALVAYKLPNIYQSETMIVVEEQKIPANMLAPLDNVDTMDRLNTLQQQILSRSNLLTVIKDFNLYTDFSLKLSDDEKLLALRNAIKVDPGVTQRETSTKVAYFKIAYENRDPYFAMRVTNRLASLFTEYDYRERQAKANATIEFFSSQVRAIEATLEEHEKRERAYRMLHQNSLSDMLDTNRQMLAMYQTKEKSATEAYDRAIMQAQNLKAQLNSTPEYLESKASKAVTLEKGEDGVVEKGPDELAVAKRDLERLQAKYTAKHPDVLRQTRIVEDLERRRRETPTSVARGGGSSSSLKNEKVVELKVNPAYQKLKLDLMAAEAEVTLRNKEREESKLAGAEFERRVSVTPEHTMELAWITRDLGSLRDRYQKLRNTLQEAKMTAEMQARQKGESFKIQDQANIPTAPYKPKRMVYVLLGAAIGLGLGILLAVLRELFDERIRTRAEIEGPLGLPVLVEIPEILNDREMQVKRMKKILAFSISIVLFVGAIATMVQLFFRNYQVIVEYVILSGLF